MGGLDVWVSEWEYRTVSVYVGKNILFIHQISSMKSWFECQVLSVRSRVQSRLPIVVIELGCYGNPGYPNFIFFAQKFYQWKNKNVYIYIIFLWPYQQKLINNPLLKSNRANTTETTATTNDSLLILCWSGHGFSSSVLGL